MKPNKGQLGYVGKLSSKRGRGRLKGEADVRFDTHGLAYLLQGINCRIGKFETLMRSRELNAEEQDQFEYNEYLRDELESIRNETLNEE